MITLVHGGSSSGKSAFAESLILRQEKKEEQACGDGRKSSPKQPSWYLATMIAWDDECRERIRKHREMRAKKNFMTVECPTDLSEVKVPAGSRCLLECVSNLAANEMYRQDLENPGREAEQRILEGIETIRKDANFLVIVTNDVSGDQGPYSPETEEYRKLLGAINRDLAALADEVYDVICGEPVPVKRRKKEDTEVEENREDRSPENRRGITLFVGGAYQGKSKLAMHEAITEEEKFVCVVDGEQSPMEETYRADVVLNLHQYIRRLIAAVLDEKHGEREQDRLFCETIRAKTEKKPEKNWSDERRIEEILYPYLDEILGKNPNVVITCDEIGCGIVPIDKRDRLWREMTGDACQYLAAHAAKVSRVVCGIPMLLKGGEV